MRIGPGDHIAELKPNENTVEPLELVTVFTDGTRIGTTTARDQQYLGLKCPRQISANQASGYCNGPILWYGVWITKMIFDGV